MILNKELIKRLPKAELHCHLDGSLRVETIIDLAQKDKIELPSFNLENLKKQLSIGENIGTLEEYISRFDITLSVMQTPESVERTAYELAEDCHNEGIRYLEVRYSPILHISAGMTMSESVDNVKIGLKKAQSDFGIKSGIIICGIRHISPEVSLKLADLAVQYKNKGVVGFDLAGAEENFPAKHHREAFELILKNNINTTLHAGEAYGPDSIHQAIHSCGAHRIGHGTRLKENSDLLKYVNDHRIPLEICLNSNIHTKSISSLKQHPFPEYLKSHLRVTINTDNRLISNTTLADEYMTAIKAYDLTLQDIRTIIINGFKSSFIPHQKRRIVIKNIVDELENEFGFEQRVIV
ncbi:MAG: adenosine deaminase [Candidatus Marinimicrobia bacterium]|nr:adenosine deaminase [Candidatus Neomarinimicrobiota bacterium]